MSTGSGPMPSWQSTQRLPTQANGMPGYTTSQSPPPSSFRGPPPGNNGDYGMPPPGQPQPFPGQPGRFRQSTMGMPSPPSGSAGRPLNRSNSYLGSGGGTPPARPDGMQPQPWPQSPGGQEPQLPSPNGQQMPHRRTQSLRPLSAFQPLDNVDRPPSPSGSTTRSIRTAAAPLTFKSPELRSALSLQEAQAKKIYMEGYLSKRDHLTPDGKPLPTTDPKKRWQLCFVQLSGTVLSVWNVHQMEEAARQGREVPPSYINVTDCFVDFVGTITESPQDVPGSRGRYENVFAINTAGQNRVLFGVEGSVGRRLVQAWVNAIRLATWEKVRLEEIYTGSLVRARLGAVSAQQATSGPGGAPGDVEMSIKSPLGKNGRMEGWVKARFMGSTEWRKCWLVLSDKGAESAGGAQADQRSETSSVTSSRNSFWSKLRAGDRGSLIGSPSTPSLADTGVKDIEVPPGSNGAPGLACFYETKKAKKPFATLAYAAHAFAVYPSRPELVEGSSLFKVEGALPLSSVVGATNRIRQSGWVMIMPELDSNSNKGANAEMMKWCIAFLDAFRLYGRPSQFQWDARNPLSPFFAYPIGPYKDRLFLDRELSEFLDIREERHLANRQNLHGIMAARMRGERTPILPPLPQPNTESTRGLNGPSQVASQAPQIGALPGQEAPSAAAPAATAATPAAVPAPIERDTLPPLATDSSDSRYGRGGPLSAIGERSREGSVMTNFTQTPITPATVEPVNDRKGAPVNTGQADASTPKAAEPTTTLPSAAVQAAVPPAAVAAPAVLAATAPAMADQSAATRAIDPIRRKDSDGMASYDEGALYFINSMGDSLPAVSPKVNSGSLPSQAATTATAPQTNGVASGVTAPTALTDQATVLSKSTAPGTPALDGMDSDARAAYSFLSQSSSPPTTTDAEMVNSKQSAVNAAAIAGAAAGAAAAARTYPSNFSSSKAQERKLAAEAEAQAHAAALAKPGRAGGPNKAGLGQPPRRGWNGVDDEDDESDEDEDEDEQSVRPTNIVSPATATRPGQQALPGGRAPYNAHLANAAQSYGIGSRGSSPGTSFESGSRNAVPTPPSNGTAATTANPTLVQLSREEQPGAISTAFQPHGLLQAGQQERAERSAKQQEAEARATGGHLVDVASQRAVGQPQGGLVGAISAHQQERRKEGGYGATLTERERERVQAEQRMAQQQQAMAAGGAPPGWPMQAGGMPGMPGNGMAGFNPMMWQQMQMMSMMNPMMFGGAPPAGPGSAAMAAQPSSQSGHGQPAMSPEQQQQMMAAQMRAAQAAQAAYMQAMQAASGMPTSPTSPHLAGHGSSNGDLPTSPSMPAMGMMPFNPYMSMYGAPMGFPPAAAWSGAAGAGSDMGSGHAGSGYGHPNAGSPPPAHAQVDPRARRA